MLIILCGCAGWSATLLFARKVKFSRIEAHMFSFYHYLEQVQRLSVSDICFEDDQQKIIIMAPFALWVQ